MHRLARTISWIWGTSWPRYALWVLSSNLIGAAAILLFIRYLIPIPGLDSLDIDLVHWRAVGLIYIAFAVIIGILATLVMFRPVLDWQRDPDAHDPNEVRNLVLRLPIYQAIVCAAVWIIGIIIAVSAAAAMSRNLALVTGISTVLTMGISSMITYLAAERLVRPIAAAALARRYEDSTLEPPIHVRLRATWALSSGLPMVGAVLLVLAQWIGMFTDNAADVLPGIIGLLIGGLCAGFIATNLVIASVVDPINELQEAINRVRRGDADAEVDIYDGSELGVLQAGFNEMMRGLKERARVRDIFGRYVGIEVAERALENKPALGGEDRKVAVLFIDVISSTTFTVNHKPEEVVQELNRFFEVVVEVVHANKGIINKFQGDAALAVFGAPLVLNDTNSMALQAARQLRDRLQDLRLQAGIGVAAGHVVAGHIGGADRFEYTVIGDAVNQAARLTDLAKKTPGRVLTTVNTLRGANEAEQARWTLLKSVELRGRHQMTQLARPIRETLADRS
ncbi:adenylate/guanylate cyclase domain-containing protein [Corynebacterium caspium]|uniref:adenylate/guanylate cyclase domain-containing protein n=1 Tax=Corynebacterium caspium TaxID=234828 RepID=UPI0003614D9D|nr:adenylate/guanylate cyclase domain-containing protein [Corynebacterium caspium]WKD58588.1 Adenylate cyclase 2 [Corynebacterium caspium DSM 44850]